MTIENGGPAFPYNETGECGVRTGMMLIDYFAAEASKEDIARQVDILRDTAANVGDVRILPDNYIAIARYMHASAMLEVRKKYV